MEQQPNPEGIYNAYDVITSLENSDWQECAASKEEISHRIKDMANAFDRFGYDKEDTPISEQIFELFKFNTLEMFPEEVLPAITGNQDEYEKFLIEAVRTHPLALCRSPKLFDNLLEPAERDALLEHQLWHDSDTTDYFTTLIDFLSPDLQEKFAKYILSYRDDIGVKQLLLLSERNLAEPTELRKKALESLRSRASFWQNTSLGEQSYHQLRKNTVDGNIEAAKKATENVQKLIDRGLLTKEEIAANICARQSNLYNYKQSYHGQYLGEAFQAEALLIQHGVLDENLPLKERVDNYLTDRYGEDYATETTYGDLQKFGLITREDLFKHLAEKWESMDASSKQWFVSELRKDDHEWTENYTRLLGQHLCDSAVNNKDHKWTYETFKFMMNEKSIDKDVKVNLLELYFAEEGHFFSLSDAPEAFGELFEYATERCMALARKEFSTVEVYRFNKLPRQDWVRFAGVTEQEVHDRQRELALESMSSFDRTLDLAFTEPELLSLSFDELIDIATELMTGNDELYADHYTGSIFGAFATCYGRAAVDILYDNIVTKIPAENIAHLLYRNIGLFCPQIYEDAENLIRHGDYYAKLYMLYIPDKWDSYVTPGLTQELVEWGFANLNTMDLTSASYQLWPYLTADQRELIFERLVANPVEAEAMLSEPAISDLFKQTKLSKTLTAPTPDTALNPQSMKTVQRRIRRYEHDKEGRIRLLSQYSYHHELASVIGQSRFSGNASTLIRHFGGAKDDRQELHALELLTLLDTYTDIQYEEAMGLSKAEAAAKTWSGMGQALGLTDTESARAAQSLEQENVDWIKFGMWLHTSLHSKEVAQYMSQYMRHRAEGGSQEEWKFSKLAQDSVSLLNDDQLTTWKQEFAQPVTIYGQQFTFRLTHAMDAIYQLGARPTYNCLHYAHGMNKRGLASLLDPSVKVLHVVNSKGKPVANAILRIGIIDGKPVLAQEPLYQSTNDAYTSRELMRATAEITDRYASSIDLQLGIVDSQHQSSLLHAIAGRFKTNNNENTQALIPKNTAPYVYSDAAGIGQRAMKLYFQPLVRIAY